MGCPTVDTLHELYPHCLLYPCRGQELQINVGHSMANHSYWSMPPLINYQNDSGLPDVGQLRLSIIERATFENIYRTIDPFRRHSRLVCGVYIAFAHDP